MEKQNLVTFTLISLAAGLAMGFGISSATNTQSVPIRETATCQFQYGPGECINYLREKGYQVIDIVYAPIAAKVISSNTFERPDYYSGDNGYVIGELIYYSE